MLHTFREDPACRIFLSTDAGGVSLNLQHATAVCNVDFPGIRPS
ncbi:helicase-related protein [Candidatus Nitrospira salsa]